MRLRDRLTEHPSAVLLGAQLAAVVAYPFFGDSPTARTLLGVVSICIVLLAVWSVRRTPALNWVAALLGLPAMILTVAEAIRPGSNAVVLSSALVHASLYFYVAWAMIRYVFKDTVVTRDELYSTGATFTVLAWAFSYVYVAVQLLQPGAFAAGDTADFRFYELLFLSFTTLTSVGLSDILPISEHARSVVIIEEVAGVMYIALVISRLVGMAVASRES